MYTIKAKLGSSLTSGSIGPGPGGYKVELQGKRQAPSFGFGSSTRDTGNKMKMQVPGPGAYRLNHSIGDVPEYAIPNRTDLQKYV